MERWTDDEKQFIRDNIGSMNMNQLTDGIRAISGFYRTYASVHRMAGSMGLHAVKQQGLRRRGRRVTE